MEISGDFGVFFGFWKAPLAKELARRYDQTEDFVPDVFVLISQEHSSKNHEKSKLFDLL
jgi:hypothetical protein